jgi:hypothetical protein
MNDPKIESMTIEDFEAIGDHRGPLKSHERKTIEAMTPNTALVLSHGDFKCGKKGKVGCYLLRTVSNINKSQQDRRWSSRHMPDGRVAVACYTR